MGTVELDLPDAPEGVQKPNAAEISSPFGPKPEITHIFRQADKRAPSSLSTTFLVLTLLPLLGFLVGVITEAPNHFFFTYHVFFVNCFLVSCRCLNLSLLHVTAQIFGYKCEALSKIRASNGCSSLLPCWHRIYSRAVCTILA